VPRDQPVAGEKQNSAILGATEPIQDPELGEVGPGSMIACAQFQGRTYGANAANNIGQTISSFSELEGQKPKKSALIGQ
jgi:hypothetical protein